MQPNNLEEKLKALPAQFIKAGEDVILKRGCVESKFSGKGVIEAISILLKAASTDGITRNEAHEIFAASARPNVDRLIDYLLERRFLVTEDTVLGLNEKAESSLDLFYWNFGISNNSVIENLAKTRVAILGLNTISCRLAEALSATGFTNVVLVDHPLLRNVRMFDGSGHLEKKWEGASKPWSIEEWQDASNSYELDCMVATTDCGSQQVLREWNEFCVKRKKHFLPVVLKNLVGYIGPFVVPGETACFECLRARQNSHLQDSKTYRLVEDAAYHGQNIIGFHPSIALILGDIAALEIAKFYGGFFPAPKIGALIEVNVLASEMDTHVVLKVPRCPVCSPLNTSPSVAIAKTSISRNQAPDD
jgi:molybdopterin-synthase adenylyltransferase